MDTFKILVLLLVGGIHLASAYPLAFINSISKQKDCPVPFQDVGGKCLYFNTLGTGTWYDMETFCHDLKGEMVKIDSADFLYDIVQFIVDEKLSPEDYWIGATDEGHEGDWRWPDNSIVKRGTPFWGTLPYEPEVQEPAGGTVENCAFLPKRYLFFMHDWDCAKSTSVICEY
uniref:C-type lectin 1 n=1 Tax=Rimicaris exoculata TaxID=71621 RepID=A0A650FK72_RIMEX|nr:C-type lectin 1 [Rimicaris exoculata]